MALQYRKIGITARSDLENRDEVLSTMITILEKAGADVFIDAERPVPSPLAKHKPYKAIKELDLLVVCGGDGTILRSIREMDDFSVPILAVHRGRVGFLAETDFINAERLVPMFLNGEGNIDERQLLSVEAMRGSKQLWKGHVLNEAVISQGAIARLIDLKVRVNNEDLTTFHADGIIVASPTGSTAYSLSSGGPIVHPSLPSMIITPINPYSFSQKPIVIPGSFVVETEVLTRNTKYGDVQISLTLDGQTYISLESGDKVTVRCDNRTVKFVRARQDTFFHTLREKLKWGEGVQD